MLKKIAQLLMLCMAFIAVSQAQVTTSTLTGVVKSVKNEALSGATVTATHTPSGTVYHTLSRKDGQFNIPNMKVGGPYKVDISYTGLQTQTYNDIYLQLGEDASLTPMLELSGATLTEVSVTAKKSQVVKEKLGPSVQIGREQLATLPTITRSISDFARLIPQAQARSNGNDGSSMGISFAGQSNKYNQFSIDGASSNDVFGLAASGTNGGQASLNPIPFDAIDQVQVVLAPYDVTLSGFTGGGVNAVTKSGSNQFHGSVYGFNQNQGMIGKSPNDGKKYGNFKDNTYGFRIGGPIIKNKLFFFLNYEGQRRTQPVDNLPGSSGSAIRTSALDSISAFLKDNSKHPDWTYDPGAYNGFDKQKKSDAFFIRFDWNISAKHKLTLRHNYVNGNNFIFSDGTNSMSFYNNGYSFYSKTNSTVLELNSNFSSKYSNVLRATYTAARDRRATPGDLFPSVVISEGGATYNFGTELSSQANSLDQDTYTLTDNFNIYAGKHTFTIGTDNSFYNSKNVFLQGLVGGYTYSSIKSFFDDASGVPTAYANRYQTTYSTDPKVVKPVADVKAIQLAFYAQDVFNVNTKFKLSYGLRADVPIFASKPGTNDAFNTSDIAIANNVATNKIPKTTVLLSPRVGFNWDIKGDKTTRLRGGAGIFTGRMPFVWVSNQYTNTGMGTLSSTLTAAQITSNNVHFSPNDPFQPATGTSPAINVTDPNFKYPRTLRANLAVDQQLPWGILGTLEGIYTKTIKDILYRDINLAPATKEVVLGDTRRPFFNNTKVNTTYGNIYTLGNTDKGYSYNFTLSLLKNFSRDFTASVAYSLGHSYSMNDGNSSTAASQYRFVYNINGTNSLDLARSNYDQGSRVIAFVNKKFKYGKFYTNVGLVYNGQSGQTFSYTFFGDLNGDDNSTAAKVSASGGADLLYLPTNVSQFVSVSNSTFTMSAADQYAAFQKYMASNEYLTDHIGKNTSRNGTRLPWENHFDLKLEQGFNIYKEHTLSVMVNVFNIGNLISKTAGRSYYITNQQLQPLNVDHFEAQADGSYKAFYYFNPTFGLNKYTNQPYAYSDYNSRWNMQIGLRYSF